MQAPETHSPLRGARSAGNTFVQSRPFEILARAGFVARGLIYGIIGVLAFDLAIGRGGKITNQQGAMRTLEHQPFGHLLLVLLAVGLAGYSLWRLLRAILGHGPEGADAGSNDSERSAAESSTPCSAPSQSRCSSDRAPGSRPVRSKRRAASSAGRAATGWSALQVS